MNVFFPLRCVRPFVSRVIAQLWLVMEVSIIRLQFQFSLLFYRTIIHFISHCGITMVKLVQCHYMDIIIVCCLLHFNHIVCIVYVLFDIWNCFTHESTFHRTYFSLVCVQENSTPNTDTNTQHHSIWQLSTRILFMILFLFHFWLLFILPPRIRLFISIFTISPSSNKTWGIFHAVHFICAVVLL